MIKFSEIPYHRPDFDVLLSKLKSLIETIPQSSNEDTLLDLFLEGDQLCKDFFTMHTLSLLRFYGNMADTFYQGEYMAFADKVHSIADEFEEVIRAVIRSPYSQVLNKRFDSRTLHILERETLLNSKNAQSLKVEIEQITNEYNKWQSQLNFNIDGQQYNAMGLMVCMNHLDRNIRKQAHNLSSEAYEKNQHQLSDWFKTLVTKRNELAQKNGDASFHQYSFKFYKREGYDNESVKRFRDAIATHFGPIFHEANHIKSSLNQIPDVKYYDEKFWFIDGNPTPKGNVQELLEKGKKMYRDLSPQTFELYNNMLECELLDVQNKPAKYGGGFATKLSQYQLPYIFTSFTGTDFDFRVLTHEFGHVYQFSHAFKNGFYGTENPTLDSVEFYSHGMEFLTYPWVPLFFEEDSKKFYIKHFIETLTIMANCCVGDEFQEHVYRDNLLDDAERNKLHLKLLQKYNRLPDFDDNTYLAAGNGWKMNGHIFNHPFYLIDYAFACVLALQLYQRMEQDLKGAWEMYQNLCNQSKGISLMEMIQMGGFKSPFDEENIKEIAIFAQSKMNAFFENYKN